MLPAVDSSGRLVGRIALIYTLSLLPISALATFTGISGTTFLIGSLLLGGVFLVACWGFARKRTDEAARRLFLASVLYLPLVLGLAVSDMDDRVAKGAFFGAEPDRWRTGPSSA